MITCAKGIGNGFPMGAVLIAPYIKPVYGRLGTTFGGSRQACTAALAVLDVMQSEHLTDNARIVGNHLMKQLKELMKTESHIKELRGRGLMVGIVLDIPQKEVRERLIYDEHCFTGGAGTDVLRILPPLTLTKELADDFIERLKRVLHKF